MGLHVLGPAIATSIRPSTSSGAHKAPNHNIVYIVYAVREQISDMVHPPNVPKHLCATLIFACFAKSTHVSGPLCYTYKQFIILKLEERKYVSYFSL